MTEEFLAEKLKLLPLAEPSPEQVQTIWRAAQTRAGEKTHNKLLDYLADILILASLLVFAFTFSTKIVIPQIAARQTPVTVQVEIPLQVRNSAINSANNSFIIYQEDAQESEININYKIENNVLSFSLPQGKYHIVFVSDKYATFNNTTDII